VLISDVECREETRTREAREGRRVVRVSRQCAATFAPSRSTFDMGLGKHIRHPHGEALSFVSQAVTFGFTPKRK